MKPKLFFIVLLSLLFYWGGAQDRANVKFGDVTVNDFANKAYAIDSNANAVMIAEIGSTNVEGNSKGWFSLIYKYYKRVHILNNKSFDIASIYLPVSGDAVVLDKLKASTYNLSEGKVIETKLNTKTEVFDEKINKEVVGKKFTFPNLKEGSIIELEYTLITERFRSLFPWNFQGEYPCLWSEYKVTIPSFFNYVFLTQGYLPYHISEQKEGSMTYNVANPGGAGPSGLNRFNAGTIDYRWVIKDIPALKEEEYTSALKNHIQRISFLLVEQKEPLRYVRYVESWAQIAQTLIEADFFGQQIGRDNGWLDDILNPLVMNIADKLDKSKKIYEYVRDNFQCDDYRRRTMDQSLKGLMKTKKGNVAEINLMLTAMLRHEGIDADPVILSTRSNGYVYSLYPVLSQYNYVVCRIQAEGKTFYLDASEPLLGFNRLPLRCYNGDARAINSSAELVTFNPDSLVETKTTSVFIVNDSKGNLIGSVQQTPGYYESLNLRSFIKDKGADELQKEIKKDFGAGISISKFGIDSLSNYDYELGIHYDFDITDEKEDIIYLNPMFGEAYKENLFKSAERYYPVEMPFAMDETFNLQMEVPAGYVIDEMPKPMIVKMNEDGDGVFEYRISQSGDNISLRSRIRMKRAYFLPDEYETLREFFNLIVKKQAELIVFKKKP